MFNTADSGRATRSASSAPQKPAQLARSCSRKAYGTKGLARVSENTYDVLDIMGTKDVEIHVPALIQIVRKDKNNYLAQSLNGDVRFSLGKLPRDRWLLPDKEWHLTDDNEGFECKVVISKAPFSPHICYVCFQGQQKLCEFTMTGGVFVWESATFRWKSGKKNLQLFQDGSEEAIAIFESTAQRRWATAPWRKKGWIAQYGVTMCGEARSLTWTRVVLATGLVAARKQNIEVMNSLKNDVSYRIGMHSLGFSSLGI